ncbi:hypothetical protein [Amycolatopsis silviterrae]|uniref:Uncharacterized protein n=1 Tax=Amycolatopsis silviterrae TaxID=1656914 RepID=A0ABW5HQA3_9PSEU
MNDLLRGPVPTVATGLLMAASAFGADPLAAVLAAAAALLVLIAARWHESAAATPAVLLAAAALANGDPQFARGCATGLLALAFLMTADARRTLAPYADPLAWLRTRGRLLLGGLGGVIAVLIGALWSFGSAWLAAAGVVALGAAYLLAVRPLARLATRPHRRRTS